MAEQPGEPKKFGLHPETYETDLLGGQYRPERNSSFRRITGFQGYLCSLLSQMFLEMLRALREARREDKHEPD